MRSTRFTVVGGLLAVLLVLSAAAAASGQARSERGAAPHAAKAATTVTLAGWASSPEETRAVRNTIASFERFNRDINVSYTPIRATTTRRCWLGSRRGVAGRLLRRLARRPGLAARARAAELADQRDQLQAKPFFKRLLGGFTVRPDLRVPEGLVAARAWSATRDARRAGVTRADRLVAVPHGADAASSTNAVPDGAPLPEPRLGAHPCVRLPEQGGVAERGEDKSEINSGANVADADYLPRAGSGRPRKTPAQLGVGWCGEALGKQKAAIIFEGNWVYGFMQSDFPSVGFTSSRCRASPRKPRVHRLVLDW